MISRSTLSGAMRVAIASATARIAMLGELATARLYLQDYFGRCVLTDDAGRRMKDVKQLKIDKDVVDSSPG